MTKHIELRFLIVVITYLMLSFVSILSVGYFNRNIFRKMQEIDLKHYFFSLCMNLKSQNVTSKTKHISQINLYTYSYPFDIN